MPLPLSLSLSLFSLTALPLPLLLPLVSLRGGIVRHCGVLAVGQPPQCVLSPWFERPQQGHCHHNLKLSAEALMPRCCGLWAL